VEDRNEDFTLQVRRGILRIIEGIEEPGQTRVILRSTDLVMYALRALSAEEGFASERFATDDPEVAVEFFGYLED
jgi:hypothetical protein